MDLIDFRWFSDRDLDLYRDSRARGTLHIGPVIDITPGDPEVGTFGGTLGSAALRGGIFLPDPVNGQLPLVHFTVMPPLRAIERSITTYVAEATCFPHPPEPGRNLLVMVGTYHTISFFEGERTVKDGNWWATGWYNVE